jgi:membrane protein
MNLTLQDMVQKYWDFLLFVLDSYIKDKCQTTAAALTYQTLFAIVPAFGVGYMLLEVFPAFEGLDKQFEEFIFSNIVPENAAVVQEYLISYSAQARSLGVVSILFIVVTSFLMLFTVERTFNQIWQVQQPRQGAQRFLMYWAVMSLAVPFVGTSIVTTSYIQTLPFISEVTESTRGLHLFQILLGSGFLTLVYLVVPNCYVRPRHALIGAVLTSIIFEMSKTAFTEIMAMSDFEAIYGTFAAVPLFLIWLYVTWTLVLAGAELVKSLGVYRFEAEEDVEAPLVQVILILELFYQAHQKGDVLRDQDIRRHTRRIHLELWPEIKAQLGNMGLIRTLEGGGMILARDLNEVSPWDIYQYLGWRLPSEVKGNENWENELAARFEEIFSATHEGLSGDLETLFKSGGLGTASAGSSSGESVTSIQEVNK